MLEVTAQAEKALQKIMDAFEHPDELPSKLKKIWLKLDRYCARWSARNQLITFCSGADDAAAYGTWRKRGRQVRRGSQSFAILKPVMHSFKKETEIQDEHGKPTGEMQNVLITYLAGFEHWPVFRIEDTDVVDEALWAKYQPEDATEFLESLPWLALADTWGLEVTTGDGSRAYGWYEHGKRIGLNAKSMMTWAHEMIHAADDRNGSLTKAAGQQTDNEIVAQVGACVLLELAGFKTEVDLRWCWEYISGYDGDPRKTAYLLTGRICNAVSLIIAEAGGSDVQA